MVLFNQETTKKLEEQSQEVVLFQKETSKKFEEQNKATQDTLALFRKEIESASSSAAQFQRLGLASQQQNNSRLATLESSMSQLMEGTRRIETMISPSLNKTMNKKDEESSTLDSQGGNP